MRSFFIPVSSILALLLIGCLSKPVSSTSGVDYTAVQIWASSDCTQPGDTIKLRATVANNGSQAVFVELIDQPVLDIWVSDSTSVLSRWSDRKPITPDLTRLELKPNETKAIEMEWIVNQPVSGTVLSIQARFIYSTRVPPLIPTVLVSVSICPGPLGP